MDEVAVVMDMDMSGYVSMMNVVEVEVVVKVTMEMLTTMTMLGRDPKRRPYPIYPWRDRNLGWDTFCRIRARRLLV